MSVYNWGCAERWVYLESDIKKKILCKTRNIIGSVKYLNLVIDCHDTGWNQTSVDYNLTISQQCFRFWAVNDLAL